MITAHSSLRSRLGNQRPARPARRAFSLATCLGLGLAAAFAPTDALADSFWNGNVDQNWDNLANFTDAHNGNVIVNTATGNFPIISATPQNGTPVDLFVGRDGGSTGRLDQTAGQAGTGNGNWMFVGSRGGTGTYNLANTAVTSPGISGYGQGTGDFTAGVFWVGGANFSEGGSGTVNINTTGTLLTTNNNQVGFCIAYNAGTTGTVNLENGTINDSNGELWVGRGGTGVLNQSAGAISSYSWFVIGLNTGSTGTVNMTGGTVNAAVNNGAATIASAGGSTGFLNVSGGTFGSTAGGLIVGEGGTGTATLSGTGTLDMGTSTRGVSVAPNGGSVGTLNLNGGTVRTAALTGGAGTSTVNFNGSSLVATAGNAGFVQGLTTANVLTGGVKINSNGFDVTVGQALLHGGAGTDGGLAKSGVGILTLTAANTYNGATTVTGGTLEISATGSLVASPSLTVTGAGSALTLDGNATLLDTLTLRLVSGTTFNLNAANGTETIGTLFLNGTPVPIGTYTAAALAARPNATGITFASAAGETLTITSVPEPSTWALGALGLVALVGTTRRRQVQSWLRLSRPA